MVKKTKFVVPSRPSGIVISKKEEALETPKKLSDVAAAFRKAASGEKE